MIGSLTLNDVTLAYSKVPETVKLPVNVVSPDKQRSMIPEDQRMLVYVNPSDLKISYQKIVERIVTRGGFVEQHFGDRPVSLSINGSTGGFVHLQQGYTSRTGGDFGTSFEQPSRRNTLSYNGYLNLLSFYKNNGAVYNTDGLIAVQNTVEVTFDNHVWYGWFSSFTVNEVADKPYLFTLSCEMTIDSHIISRRYD